VSDQQRTGRRLQRARTWLVIGISGQLGSLVGLVVLVSLGRVQPPAVAVVALGLMGAPLVVLAWTGWRRSGLDRPANWPGWVLAAALSQTVAWVLTMTGSFGGNPLGAPWLRVVVPTLVASIPTAAAVLAARSVLRPLSAELGQLDVEVRVKIRTGTTTLPHWIMPDEVRLTARELVTLLRPSPSYAAVDRVALADVTGIEIRAGRWQDNPWMRLPDGREYHLPPGEVVEVRLRHGTRVLPVSETMAFTEVLRARVARARSTAARS
jgi:hypothetical protein